MTLLSTLTRPRLPRTAFVLDSSEVAAVELRRRGGNRFAVVGAAYQPLPAGLVTPSFDGTNIANRDELAQMIFRTVEAAGLSARQRWSMLLPEEAVKTVLVPLESVPGSRDELNDMIAFKTSHAVGVAASELRITRQLVETATSARFIVVVARESVLAEYEALVETLGWRVGLVVPRYVGEAAWFDWDGGVGDKLLLSARDGMCTSAVVRGGDLALVRAIDGDPARFADEVYRLALYYRDRIVAGDGAAMISRVLTSGSIDGEQVASAIAEALGSAPMPTHPVPELVDLPADTRSLPALVAAAGLATQAWAR